MIWVFGNVANTVVKVDNKTSVMWDAVNNHPRDMAGYWAQLWQDDGSPTPDPFPYVP